MSDADEAKKWASEYIADLKPRLSELFSINYEMNFLKVLLGLSIKNHSFKWNAPSEVVRPLGYDCPTFRRTKRWLESERNQKILC